MSRAALSRYAGLAGSLLLAVAAWLGGASSPWQPTVTPRTIFAGENGVLLPLSWLLGTLLMIGAWWFGRRAVPSARWAYITAALWAVPLLPFLPLGSYDVYSYACQGWQQSAGLDPYAGGVDLLGCPWREAVAPTWLDSPAPYGPVFLVLAAAAAKLGVSLIGTLALLRVIAVLGVVLIAVCLPVLARWAGVPLKRAVWLTLACPLVPIHLISGAHNDAVMVGLLVAALALATRRRDMWAVGILFGLAIGV
jgi:alpha-1,6-mannosyltransferase